ncbi:MAG: tripartite tricarboxylate transporter substrate binding protein [Alphaproteobacteria bacterium]|nr:tripartite tricarboxylate transporter substrate binding protein [Alphaproteobacteria bacterium]
MKTISKNFIIIVALFMLPFAIARAEYPDKPVTFVIPFPPGDLEDILTRMIAEDFQKTYGVSAAVVNKPAGGNPFAAAVEVAKAPADGYMIGSFIIAIPVVGPTLGIPDLSPDPFTPIGNFLTYPFVIVAGKNAPYDDMQGLAKYAKKNDVALGHFGVPLVPTRVTFALAKKMGFSYASDAAFDKLDCNTLASGDVDVMNTTIQLILPCLKDVKVLASIGDDRISLTPKTPTVKEFDKTLDVSLWNGLFVKKGTPKDVQQKIAKVAKKTVLSKKAQKIAQQTGALIYWQDGKIVTKKIKKDIATLENIKKILE